MSLNKLLCKYLDEDGKGYVTIGDVVWSVFVIAYHLIFIVSVVIIAGGAYLYGAWLSYHGVPYSAGASIVDGVSVLWFAGVSIAIIIIVGGCVAAKLASIRVATCEQKERDE